MGVVYRAMDLNLGRVVALKVLHDHLRTRSQCVTRLQREARAIAGLNHPSIVQVYAVGEIGNVAYFAMEYVEGRPLSTILMQEGPMPWPRALHIAAQIADALTCAHEAQIIHRDVKPPNVIITSDDRVYVTDFGVAKVLTAETQLTIDASRLGTPSYMSPEHCQNAEVTASSDFYSLGVLIFQMISGRLPHEAKSRAQLAEKIIASPPARLRDYVPDVPEGVDRLVAHLLEKRPKDRPANGRVLLELIERVAQGETLDEGCRERVAAMATLRESYATPISSGDDSSGRGARTPTPRPRPGSGTHDRPSTHHGLRIPARRWLTALWSWRTVLWVITIWAAVCAAATGALLAEWDAPSTLIESGDPGLDRWKASADVARFAEAAPGVSLAHIDTPGWPVATVGWLDAATGAVLLAGRDGSNGLVLCPLNPEANSASAHFIPRIPGYGPAGAVLDFGSTLRHESPLGDRLLVAFAKEDAVPAGLAAIVPPPRQAAPLALSGASIYAGVAAARPDGAALAVITSPYGGATDWTVSQQELSFAGPTGAPRPLTRPGSPVIAMQYSPDGSHLAYVRQTSGGHGELWLVRTNGSELDGIAIAKGSISLGSNAFSRDGFRLAVTDGSTPQSRELRIYSLTGAGVENLGKAYTAAWHPAGDYLVITAPEEDGRLQLWTVRAAAPYSRQILTQLPTGIGPLCRISPDGTRALTFLDKSDTPTAVFVNLQPTR
jgi:predicted Ser/Thr protein kinase